MAKHSTSLPDFEASMAELERIVLAMESGQMSLNEMLSAYQRGATLLHHCQETLGAAETQIKILEAGVLRSLDGFTPSSSGEEK